MPRLMATERPALWHQAPAVRGGPDSDESAACRCARAGSMRTTYSESITASSTPGWSCCHRGAGDAERRRAARAASAALLMMTFTLLRWWRGRRRGRGRTATLAPAEGVAPGWAHRHARAETDAGAGEAAGIRGSDGDRVRGLHLRVLSHAVAEDAELRALIERRFDLLGEGD